MMDLPGNGDNTVMGLIDRFFGTPREPGQSGGKAPTIVDTEAALAALSEEREAARDAIAVALKKRTDLLFVDDSDEEIGGLDRAVDAHHLKVERCDAIEPLLIKRLGELKDDARREALQKLRRRHDQAFADYLKKMRAVSDAFDKIAAIRQDAMNGGFQRELGFYFLVPVNVFDRNVINRLEADFERIREFAEPKAIPAPVIAPAVVAAPKPAPKPAVPTYEAKAPAPVLAPTPDADGNVPVIILRGGVEGKDGTQYKAGSTVLMPYDDAYKLLLSAAADWGVWP